MANKLTVTINGKQYVTKPANEAAGALSKIGTVAQTVNKVTKIAFASVAVAAAGAVAGLVVTVKQATEAGDRIDKLSQQIGLSRESFQQWDYVLSQTGTEIAGLKTGVKTLWTALEQAERGSDKYAETLERLGVSIRDSNDEYRDRESIFTDVVMALSEVNNETERSILANNLLGRAASQLEPLFNSGAEAINGMLQEAQDLGIIMSDSAVDAAVRWKDSIDRIKRVFNTFKNETVAPIMEILANVADAILPIISEKMTILKTQLQDMTDPTGVQNISNIVSKMLLDAITFASFFPKIMVAAISDIKASWDDLWSGDRFARKMDAFAVNLTEVIQSLVSMLGTALSGAFEIITQALNNAIGTFFNAIFSAFAWLTNGVAGLVNKAINPMINLINKLFGKDLETDPLKPVAEMSVPMFDLAETINEFNETWNASVNRFMDSLDGNTETTDESLVVMDTVGTLLNDLQTALDSNTVAVEENSGAVSGDDGTGTGNGDTGTPETVLSFFDKLVGFGSTLFGMIESLSSVQQLLDPIGTILAGMMEVLGPVIDELLAPLVGILKIFGQLLGSLLVPVLQILTPIIEVLANTFIWLYNKILLPVGNGIIRVFNIVQYRLIQIINGVITAINWALGWLGVNISKLALNDINANQLSAIDTASLTTASGISSTDYSGSTVGSSTSVQSVTINIYQYYDGPVIGEGGMEQVGEFVTQAIQAYTGVGGKTTLVTA